MAPARIANKLNLSRWLGLDHKSFALDWKSVDALGPLGVHADSISITSIWVCIQRLRRV